MPAYKMLSDPFLARFKSFMDAERRNPEGAFDGAEIEISKGKTNALSFRACAGCGGTLFLRERSNDLAFDEAPTAEISDPASRILAFLKNKLDEATLHEVSEMLKAEAGIETDLQKESRAKIEAAKERGATAQDARRRRLAADASAAASNEEMAKFAARFPGAARIGQV